MTTILMSIGDRPAAQGFGGVISSALLAVGTLALIYLVLVLIDRHYKKHKDDTDTKTSDQKNKSPETFRDILDEEIEKNKEKDVNGKI